MPLLPDHSEPSGPVRRRSDRGNRPDRARPLGTPPAHDFNRPHAYKPEAEPELFAGVLQRRFGAFLVDACIIIAPIVALSLVFTVFGVLTLGLGFVLLWLLGPIAVGWALFYTAMTLGGPFSATVGMRMNGLEMRTWYGAKVYPLLACVHLIALYISVSALTPLVLAVGLFNGRRRLLHDFICGMVMINTVPRSMELVIRR
ncbi:RDD family protein [Blastochloris viridis]|uniref:RDD family protein n=1 Tax=Blastochloris viridis TaxID=1079 RepID=A0A0H5BG77_BLAVI|nr:RDD family protein [Blastochloris viridis]ALK09963.1 RDD family protein [Blastochloris viridis]BAS00125.1 hypothetical protein BV133_2531 [Blastochloris viridis]CUU42626.1 RDD family protein [Blastochloris viridis]